MLSLDGSDCNCSTFDGCAAASDACVDFGLSTNRMFGMFGFGQHGLGQHGVAQLGHLQHARFEYLPTKAQILAPVSSVGRELSDRLQERLRLKQFPDTDLSDLAPGCRSSPGSIYYVHQVPVVSLAQATCAVSSARPAPSPAYFAQYVTAGARALHGTALGERALGDPDGRICCARQSIGRGKRLMRRVWARAGWLRLCDRVHDDVPGARIDDGRTADARPRLHARVDLQLALRRRALAPLLLQHHLLLRRALGAQRRAAPATPAQPAQHRHSRCGTSAPRDFHTRRTARHLASCSRQLALNQHLALHFSGVARSLVPILLAHASAASISPARLRPVALCSIFQPLNLHTKHAFTCAIYLE
eukprot:6193455-Pleurochrysis_carterae.AAC.1